MSENEDRLETKYRLYGHLFVTLCVKKKKRKKKTCGQILIVPSVQNAPKFRTDTCSCDT